MAASDLAYAALVCAGERIAFEVDGPHHFTANTLAVTGEMLARQKLLRARGWAVISVPFFHWAGQADEARAHWLLQVRLQSLELPCCAQCGKLDVLLEPVPASCTSEVQSCILSVLNIWRNRLGRLLLQHKIKQ